MPGDRKCLVVANGFGVPKTLKSNQTIAILAAGLARKHGCPVFTQLDVDIEFVDSSIKVIRVEEDPTTTWRMNEEVADYAVIHDITDIYVVGAAPSWWPHIVRCVRDLKESLAEIEWGDINVHPCLDAYQYGDSVWFDPASKQPWTRSRSAWWKREMILQLMPFWLYKWATG